MVNLPEREDVEVHRPAPIGGRRPHSHRNWGARFGRRREEKIGLVPTTLHDLENLADRAVEIMERHVPKSEYNFFKVMDLLRLQYNLVSSFIIFSLLLYLSFSLSLPD